MRPFTQETAAMLRLPVANVDTDQLIPARFMKEPRKPEGYGRFLLHDLAAEGSAPAPQAGQAILVARRNFGCGSSREAVLGWSRRVAPCGRVFDRWSERQAA